MSGNAGIARVLGLLNFRVVGEFRRDKNLEYRKMNFPVKQQSRSYADFVKDNIYKQRMLSLCSRVQQASHDPKVLTLHLHHVHTIKNDRNVI